MVVLRSTTRTGVSQVSEIHVVNQMQGVDVQRYARTARLSRSGVRGVRGMGSGGPAGFAEECLGAHLHPHKFTGQESLQMRAGDSPPM